MPSNSLLLGRGHLKGSLRAFALLACAIAGCAKFPTNGDTSSFIKVSFYMRLQGVFRSDYIYDVAIRTSTDPNPESDPNRVPQPVIGQNNPNGRVAGSPTHLIEYAPSNPVGPDPFTLYRFSTQAEVPNTSDPDNPINLGSFPPATRGRIFSYDTPVPGESKEIRFDVFMNVLGDTDEAARAIQSLQVQFLTMNRLSFQGSGNRVIDYLGFPNQAEFIKVDLRSNNQYGNTSGLLGSGIEPDDDCPDPDLNIVDWGITVVRP